MIRVFLIVLGAGVTLLVVAALYICAFPPKVTQHDVAHTIPNTAFAAGGGPAGTPAPAPVPGPVAN